MTQDLKQKLIFLAEQNEVSQFLNSDPSQFSRWYKNPSDCEIASFIAAILSFGNRKQFIPKIKQIFELADKSGGIYKWIKTSSFLNDFNSADSNNQKKFYRFYSYEDMHAFFSRIKLLLEKNSTFGEFVKNEYQTRLNKSEHLSQTISRIFDGCKVVPQGKTCANKRVNMFLRWMVRQNSPVDLGIWTWFDSKDLIIPLDTHVIQQSVKYGLIEKNAASSLKTALLITEQLKLIWPNDPCKGDFALFGEGVNSK